MQIGPIFGVVAVLITAVTVDLWIIGGTRLLEGAAAAASIPSILGYIALATSGDQSIRGRAVSRFEAATLLGIGFGIVAAGPIFDAIGRVGFVVNGGIYVLSFAHLPLGRGRAAPRAGVGRRGGRAATSDRSAWTCGRYRAHPGLVAGLAAGADLDRAERGARLVDHPIGLPAGPRAAAASSSNQLLMQGISPTSVSVAFVALGSVFVAGLWYWGNRFKRYRRTSIIAIGLVGALVMLAAGLVLNHSEGWPLPIQLRPGRGGGGSGCS